MFLFNLIFGGNIVAFVWRIIVALAVLTAIGILGLAISVNWAHAADAAMGDCIALGTGHALRVPTQARVNAGSCEIARYATARTPWDHLVISAGINDGGNCVAQLRARVRARQVTWILPAPINVSRRIVADVAAVYGDRTVSYTCPGGCSKRSFHPASYGVVADAVRRTWRH